MITETKGRAGLATQSPGSPRGRGGPPRSKGRRRFLLALALAQAAVAPALEIEETLRIDLPEIRGEDEIDLEADSLIYYRAVGRAEAKGDARLLVRDIELTAEELVLDLGAGLAVATGNVVLRHGQRRLLASELQLEIDSMHAVASSSRLLIIDPRTGRLHLDLGAERLERRERNLFLVEGLCLTTCDCPDDIPASWSLTARSARIDPDQGAWLLGTWFRIREVPVIPLPVFYLPLGERRSGLLAPRFGFSGRNGFQLAQPLYLALGRSWDMTLTAGWYWGDDTWEADPPLRPGVRGPEQSMELRWAPARRSQGHLTATHLFDLHRDAVDEEASSRGSRVTLQGSHTSRFDGRGFGEAGHGAHLSLNLLSDAALLGDLRPTLEEAQRGYLRSTARTHATILEHGSLEAGGRWLQDIRRRLDRGPDDLPRVRPLFGADAPDTAQLLPVLLAGSSPVPIAGGLGGRGELRFASWRRPFVAEERAVLHHLRGNAELSHALAVGGALAGRASASLAADAWRESGEDASLGRLYPRLEASVNTGLERRFSVLAHRVRPIVRWRFVPAVVGEAPDSLLDVYEIAVAPNGLHQLPFAVSNEGWSAGWRSMELTLQQGVDLHESRLSDLDMSLTLDPPGMPHRLEARGGFCFETGHLSWATATGRLVWHAGARVGARWWWVDPAAGTTMMAGLEEIFAAGALPPPPLQEADARIHEAVVSLVAPRMRGLSLRYDVSLELTDSPRPPQHRAIVAYVSPCRCWSGSIRATWPPGETIPEMMFAFELTGLGSAATRPGGI